MAAQPPARGWVTREQARRLVRACGYGEALTTPLALADAEAAKAEELAALLGFRVLRGETTAATADLEDSLVAEYRRCARGMAVVELGLVALSDVLQRECIPFIALKGLALHRLVYGNSGARPMSDCDLLVRSREWHRALTQIVALGGKLIHAPGRVLTKRHFHEYSAVLRGGAVVDLHRRLHPWPLWRIDHDALFRRATSSPDGWLIPDPIDLFVGLATHAAQDGFSLPLRYVVDALAVAGLPGVAPMAVCERAREWRATKAVAIWLRVLVDHGLSGEGWASAVEALDPLGRTASRAEYLPLSTQARRQLGGWRWRIELLRSLDGPVRPAAFLLARGAMYAADLVWRLAPQGKGSQ